MKWHYLNIIACNNLKLILRNRSYQLFFLFFFILIIYFHVRYQSNISEFSKSGIFTLAAFVPYMNTYFFSLLHVILLSFLAMGIMGKERKLDSMEAIYYRPESNAEYVWGVCLGFMYAFLLMGAISLGVAMLIQLCLSDAPFYFPVYLFYLFTLVVPTTVFVLGFSLFIQCVVKSELLGLTLLLLYMVTTVFYLQDVQHGVFDFMGITLPNAWSEMTGHPNLTGYLLQRGCWLFLGIGLVQWSVLNFDRLANSVEKRRVRVGKCLVFIVIGVVCGFAFFVKNENKFSLRQKYIEVYEKYGEIPKAEMLCQDIYYRQEGGRVVVESRLTVQNTTGQQLQEIILYLNPTLKIKRVEVDGVNTRFEREYQVTRVQKSLDACDSTRVHIVYEGKVDENVCYLDLPEEEVVNTKYNQYLTCRFGKRYVFQDENFTLLIPEALWYPMTEPPVNPSASCVLNRNLTRYTLRVDAPEGKIVVAQGKREVDEEGYATFNVGYSLLGLSLCIGSYETFRITLDSVDCELNVFKRSRALFDGLEEFDAERLSELKHSIEEEIGDSYPYHRFVVTEVPVSFTSYYRNDRQKSEYIQPEMVFLPERGTGQFEVHDSSMLVHWMNNLKEVLWSRYAVDNTFVWKELFGLSRWNMAEIFSKNFHVECSPYLGYSLFSNEEAVFRSKDYPIMNVICNLILREGKIKEFGGMSRGKLDALNYLIGNSLKDALTDKLLPSFIYEILLLKSDEFLDYLEWKGVARDSVCDFISGYLDVNRFKYVDFKRFDADFKDQFGVGWEERLSSWYTDRDIPRFWVKDFVVERVDAREEMGWTSTTVQFEIFNDSDTDGLVRLQSSSSSLTGGTVYVPWGEIQESTDVFYEIKARERKKVVLFVEKSQRYFKLSFGYSANIPNEVVTACDMKEGVPGKPACVEVIDRNDFMMTPDEIVVDNEDKGFRVVKSSSRLRDYFNKKTGEDKYENLVAYVFMNDTWKCLVNGDAYGPVIKSAMYRLVGKGDSSLEWTTNLEKEGMYEVFIYVPSVFYTNVLFPGGDYSNLNSGIQTYKVFLGDEEKEVLVNIHGTEGWLSIGEFYGRPGKSKVSLSDIGEPKQVMAGDAVKWVYKGDKK